MAATVVSAPGTTARTSATISVPAGSVYNLFLYTDAGSLPPQGGAAVYVVTPSGLLNVKVAELNAANNYSAAITGPVDVVVQIPASSTNVGVARYP